MSYLGQVELKSSDIRRVDVTSSTSATHTLTWTPPSEQSLIVTINGVKQQNNYTISGTTLTLDSALVSSDELEVVGILDIGTTNIPADDSITNAMVKSDAAIAQSKLATLAIDTAELADDAVTTDKLANSINTEIAANTAKVTNATHTGDVTGATALTIATDAVDIAMLSATGTASATTFLRGDNAWTTPPAGALVLISKNTLNSVVATWDITDQFSATYTNYLIVMDKLVMDTENVHLNIRFGNSDLSSTDSSTYHGYYLSSANGQVNYSGAAHANGLRLADGLHNATTLGFSGILWVNDVQTTNTTMCTGSGMYYGNANTESHWMVNYGSFGGSQDSLVSIQFLGDSGSIGDTGVTSTVTVYGLAES